MGLSNRIDLDFTRAVLCNHRAGEYRCAGCKVNPEIATAQGLRSHHDDQTYYFCGKGCKLDFDENPERILDPSYTPSM